MSIHTLDSTARRREILARLADVPAPAAAGTDLIAILQCPDYPTDEVVRRIEVDAGLTAGVLRAANSAMLGGRRAVVSVRDAVLRLGARRVCELAVAGTLQGHLRPSVPGYDLPAGALWLHSAATAVSAERLAAHARIPAPPYLFTAALLHDIGSIVLGAFVENESSRLLALAFAGRTSFDEAEAEVLGIDHAEVGAMLLEQWNLSPDIVEVVRWHHAPERSGKPATFLVHIADMIAMTCGFGGGADGVNYRLHAGESAPFPLGSDVIEKAMTDLLSEMEKISQMLGPAEGSKTDGV